MDNMNEYSAAASFERPKKRAPAIVEPLLETPGNMATPCIRPTPRDSVYFMCSMSFLPWDSFSLRKSITAVIKKPMPKNLPSNAESNRSLNANAITVVTRVESRRRYTFF